MTRSKSFADLIKNCPSVIRALPNIPQGEVSNVVFDSRKVVAGSVFVAFEGEYFDGHCFIGDAVSRGATLVVGTQAKWVEEYPNIYLRVEDARKALAYLSAAYHDFPARKLVVIGVTGTDGKTTTVNLIYQVLKQAGMKVGMISTVNAVIGEEAIDTGFHVTTPESPMVQELLARMVENGMTHVVLETTSHGLAQQRVAACEYDIGVITNVTHEHLDYHGTYESYVQTKTKLLTMLTETLPKRSGNIRLAVINKDDQSYSFVTFLLSEPAFENIQIAAYSRKDKAEIKVAHEEHSLEGLRLQIDCAGQMIHVESHLVGEYNVSNILAAVGATSLGLKIAPEAISRGIKALGGVPGRMERINMGQNFSAIVDFAHTPNAIKVTLQTARELTRKRVLAVFGSAGLRDREKRKMMAIEGVNLADICIFTAEDPRTEELEDILNEMVTAAEGVGGVEGKDYLVVPDRGDAIRQALKLAHSDDLVIVCGKGHEQSMCFETTEYPWDDRTAVRAALCELLGKEGPNMPYLPTSMYKKRAD